MHDLDLETWTGVDTTKPRINHQVSTSFYFSRTELKSSKHSAPLQIIDLVCCLPLPSAESTLMPPFIRKLSTSSQIKFVASSLIAMVMSKLIINSY